MSADRNGKRLDNNRLWASVAAPGLVLAVLLLVVPGARAQDDPAQRRQEFYDNLKILGDVYERVINNYVDEVDPHEVMKAAVEGHGVQLVDQVAPQPAPEALVGHRGVRKPVA